MTQDAECPHGYHFRNCGICNTNKQVREIDGYKYVVSSEPTINIYKTPLMQPTHSPEHAPRVWNISRPASDPATSALAVDEVDKILEESIGINGKTPNWYGVARVLAKRLDESKAEYRRDSKLWNANWEAASREKNEAEQVAKRWYEAACPYSTPAALKEGLAEAKDQIAHWAIEATERESMLVHAERQIRELKATLSTAATKP